MNIRLAGKAQRMTNIRDAARDAINSAWCGYLRGSAEINRLWVASGLPYTGAEEWINSQRSVYCNQSPDTINSIPSDSPDFTGGQCDAPYTISYEFVQFNGSGAEVGRTLEIKSATGPITQITAEDRGSAWCVQIIDANFNPATCDSILGKAGASYEFQNITITRVDGSPDNCGDPPTPEPPPLETVDIPAPVTYTDDVGLPVAIPDATLKVFPPCPPTEDGLFIPVELVLPDPLPNLCGKIGIRPDIFNGIEPAVEADLCPDFQEDVGLIPSAQEQSFFELGTTVGSVPGVPEIILDGDLNETFDLSNPPMFGVLVKSRRNPNEVQSGTQLIRQDDSAPVQVIPRLATVRFQELVQTGDDDYETAFGERIDVQVVNAWVSCPSPHGAVGVVVEWQNGYEGNYTPGFRKSCCDSCAEQVTNDEQRTRCT